MIACSVRLGVQPVPISLGRPATKRPSRNPDAPGSTPLPRAARPHTWKGVTTASGIDAEDIAALCLLEADGDLAIPCADLLDAGGPGVFPIHETL